MEIIGILPGIVGDLLVEAHFQAGAADRQERHNSNPQYDAQSLHSISFREARYIHCMAHCLARRFRRASAALTRLKRFPVLRGRTDHLNGGWVSVLILNAFLGRQGCVRCYSEAEAGYELCLRRVDLASEAVLTCSYDFTRGLSIVVTTYFFRNVPWVCA